MALIEIHVHRVDDGILTSIVGQIAEIRALVQRVIEKENETMATIDEVLADVQAESTQLDSLAALIGGLRTQLADALADTTIPAETQAKIDAVFTAVEANKAKIMGALTTTSDGTTPATPVETPVADTPV